ncbi:hypothetical protein D3C75_969220 [compost metagenome]
MTGVDNYPVVAQALEPGTQQRGGFHIAGENPARAADKRLDAQVVNPLAQCISVKAFEQPGNFARAFGVTGDEGRVRFGMGDVHATDASQKEFSSN